MMTVHEVSALTGVSIRALHHYDAIGLLKPTAVTEAGYRLYGKSALERLQEIMLLRELEFPLREIARILDSPGFDRKAALFDQLELLRLRRERLSRLIELTETTIKGGYDMDFSAFDDREERKYAAEAKRRWGDTAAWREYESKRPGAAAEEGLMALFARFGKLKELPPEDEKAQAATEELRSFISANYYNCTPEILRGLGQMYVSDPRFKENIDGAGGEGTAEFVSKAIEYYCKKG